MTKEEWEEECKHKDKLYEKYLSKYLQLQHIHKNEIESLYQSILDSSKVLNLVEDGEQNKFQELTKKYSKLKQDNQDLQKERNDLQDLYDDLLTQI